MTTLMNWLCAIHPISNELRDRLEAVVKVKLIVRKDYLHKAGHYCRNIYFVEKGLLWTYYFQKGKVISSAFAKENDICASWESFFTQQYGLECIQALEDTDLSYISYNDYQELCKGFPEFNTICRLLLERCHVTKEQRLSALWMQPAADRLRWFANQYPDLFQRVPGKYLASYLGMSNVVLSRMRGRHNTKHK